MGYYGGRGLASASDADKNTIAQAASQFGALSPQASVQQYKQIRDNLPLRLAMMFPDEDAFAKNPAGTIAQAQKVGMTPEQQATVQTSQQRADIYEENIEDLMKSRPEDAQLKRDRLAAQIDRDTGLDETRRIALRQQLEIADQTLAQRKAEMGARAENVKTIQDAITARQVQRGQSGPQALRTAQAALAVAQKLPGYGNLSEEDQVSTVNALIDSGLGNQAPVISTQPGKPSGILQKAGITSTGGGPKVTQGAPIAKPTVRVPATSQPPKTATRADLQAYATQNGLDYPTAEAQFRAKGYKIVER